MPIDINLKRRKHELAIADELVIEFLDHLDEIAAELQLVGELQAHPLALRADLVFERLGIVPTEAEIDRILTYAAKKVATIRRGL